MYGETTSSPGKSPGDEVDGERPRMRNKILRSAKAKYHYILPFFL